MAVSASQCLVLAWFLILKMKIEIVLYILALFGIVPVSTGGCRRDPGAPEGCGCQHCCSLLLKHRAPRLRASRALEGRRAEQEQERQQAWRWAVSSPTPAAGCLDGIHMYTF